MLPHTLPTCDPGTADEFDHARQLVFWGGVLGTTEIFFEVLPFKLFPPSRGGRWPMLRLPIVCNAINHDAVRRLRRIEREATGSSGSSTGSARRRDLEVVFYEPGRVRLGSPQDGECRRRLPINRITLAFAAVLAGLGLVDRVSLPHLRNAGRFMLLVVRRARRLTLPDDGLDQYRSRPRTVDPQRFAPGTPYWLFSDAADLRAPWCARFDCRELAPLFPGPVEASPAESSPIRHIHPRCSRRGATAGPGGTSAEALVLALHPVAHKRSWTLPPQPDDGFSAGPPEDPIRSFPGLMLVG